MRLRNLVSYLWVFFMFVLTGFGSFYIITGQNILTGQKRDSDNQVLPAKDVSVDQASLEVSEKEKEESLSPELLLFNEVMAKTTDKSGVRLDPLEKSEAAVFYRFGFDKKSSNYYIATFASGLSPDKFYTVWLGSGEDYLKLGAMQELDKSGVIKLGYKTQDSSVLNYDTALVTIGESADVDTFDKSNLVFSSSFDPKEIWGEEAFLANKTESKDSENSQDNGNTTTDPSSNGDSTTETP